MMAGGFGGSGGGKGLGKKDAAKGSASTATSTTIAKQIKLKPKQQWDRYMDLKAEAKIPVGIRIKNDEESKDWMGVGHVRSKDGAYTTVSVALQRALIAEVGLVG